VGLIEVTLDTGAVTRIPPDTLFDGPVFDGPVFDGPVFDGLVFDGPVAALRCLLAALSGPLDAADVPLAIVAGVVGGVGAPGTARCAAIGVSPLSGGVAETRAEGPFAAGLRAAGVTGVILAGRAPEPVCVVVEDGSARLEPATGLWGLETGPATDLLLERYGTENVAVIGPAGENQVRYASIVTCRHHPLPRLGLGAVLGAKRVKAVVCIGTRQPPVADPATLARISADYAAALPGNRLTAWQQGRPGFGVWTAEPGYATVANFTDTSSPSGVGVLPPEIARTAGVAACPGCPTDCIKLYAGAGLHQEALAMLGPGLGVPDPWPLLARCEQLGLDPVSLGGTLAAAGVRPTDVPAVVERIATGRDPLAQGSARSTPDTAMTSKNVELPPFDPRVQPNLGLAYAVAPIGPRYDIVEHDLDFDPDEGMPDSFGELRLLGVEVPRPRGELDVWRTAQLMRLWSGLDALGICLYAATPTRPLRLAQIEALVTAITGGTPEVLALGAERLRLQHEINTRLGVAGDTLPDVFFTEPVRRGRYAGSVLDRAAFTAAVSDLRTELGFNV
jgi:aldehyde:ferredoxin oxidoreductase